MINERAFTTKSLLLVAVILLNISSAYAQWTTAGSSNFINFSFYTSSAMNDDNTIYVACRDGAQKS